MSRLYQTREDTIVEEIRDVYFSTVDYSLYTVDYELNRYDLNYLQNIMTYIDVVYHTRNPFIDLDIVSISVRNSVHNILKRMFIMHMPDVVHLEPEKKIKTDKEIFITLKK
jgi:hypothetical protein